MPPFNPTEDQTLAMMHLKQRGEGLLKVTQEIAELDKQIAELQARKARAQAQLNRYQTEVEADLTTLKPLIPTTPVRVP